MLQSKKVVSLVLVAVIAMSICAISPVPANAAAPLVLLSYSTATSTDDFVVTASSTVTSLKGYKLTLYYKNANGNWQLLKSSSTITTNSSQTVSVKYSIAQPTPGRKMQFKAQFNSATSSGAKIYTNTLTVTLPSWSVNNLSASVIPDTMNGKVQFSVSRPDYAYIMVKCVSNLNGRTTLNHKISTNWTTPAQRIQTNTVSCEMYNSILGSSYTVTVTVHNSANKVLCSKKIIVTQRAKELN